MSIGMAAPVPARVLQVLKDYLAGELALVDSEQGGDPTPTPASTGFYDWEIPVAAPYPPSIATRVNDSTFDDILQVSALSGGRINAVHGVDVLARVGIGDAGDMPADLQRWCFRYGAAIVRTLTVQHDGLDTVADPGRWASSCYPVRTTYGPEQGQGTGQQTRTATVTIAVRRIEYRWRSSPAGRADHLAGSEEDKRRGAVRGRTPGRPFVFWAAGQGRPR